MSDFENALNNEIQKTKKKLESKKELDENDLLTLFLLSLKEEKDE